MNFVRSNQQQMARIFTISNRFLSNKMSIQSLTNGHDSKSSALIIKQNAENAVLVARDQMANGCVIAVPTDTVYGLACNANDPIAIRRLYDIKGRDNKNPVAICVSNIGDLKRYGEADHLPDELLNRLLPGAVTIVLNKTKHLNNPYLNPGISKIAIRIPNLDFIRNVAGAFDCPVALTSANRSSEKSTLEISEFKLLWPKLGAVFDGGRIGLAEEQRAASTIVDLCEPNLYEITRTGVAVQQTIKVLEMFGLKAKSMKLKSL